MHDQIAIGIRRLLRLAVGDDESKAVVSLRVEGNRAAGPTGVRRAAGALAGELPVGAVDFVAGGELLDAGSVVDGGLGVRAGRMLVLPCRIRTPG